MHARAESRARRRSGRCTSEAACRGERGGGLAAQACSKASPVLTANPMSGEAPRAAVRSRGVAVAGNRGAGSMWHPALQRGHGSRQAPAIEAERRGLRSDSLHGSRALNSGCTPCSESMVGGAKHSIAIDTYGPQPDDSVRSSCPRSALASTPDSPFRNGLLRPTQPNPLERLREATISRSDTLTGPPRWIVLATIRSRTSSGRERVGESPKPS